MATMRNIRAVRIILFCLFLITLAVITYDPIIYIFGLSASNGTAVLRVMVLSFNRAESLKRCLDSLNAAKYDGFPVAVDIYLDLNKQKEVHNATLSIAKNFVFKHGPKEVHVRPRHVGVLGQWLQTWRVPRDNTAEIAVFVEDDITLSPYFARWLRRVHDKYDSYPGVNGYALQGESTLHGVKAQGNLHGPPGQSVFLYPVLGSWGFSPKTAAWRHFIRWVPWHWHNICVRVLACVCVCVCVCERERERERVCLSVCLSVCVCV